MKTIAPVIILLVVGVFGWRGLSQDVYAARAEADALRAERDSLALEAVAERARADGWVTMFAENSPEALAERLAQIDSARARDLRASGVRVAQLASLVATLRDSVQSVGSRASSPGESLGGPADSLVSGEWVGSLSEGPLDAAWRFRLPAVTLDLSYTVEVAGTLVQSEAGDRTLVMARSDDPRVSFSIPELVIAPAPPRIEYREPSLWSKARTAAGWAALGYLAGALTP